MDHLPETNLKPTIYSCDQPRHMSHSIEVTLTNTEIKSAYPYMEPTCQCKVVCAVNTEEKHALIQTKLHWVISPRSIKQWKKNVELHKKIFFCIRSHQLSHSFQKSPFSSNKMPPLENFNLFVVSRHEVHGVNTHTLHNAGWPNALQYNLELAH